MKKWTYSSEIFEAILAIVGEVVIIPWSKEDNDNLHALHRHQESDVAGVL